jgi:hypothetical protein
MEIQRYEICIFMSRRKIAMEDGASQARHIARVHCTPIQALSVLVSPEPPFSPLPPGEDEGE